MVLIGLPAVSEFYDAKAVSLRDRATRRTLVLQVINVLILQDLHLDYHRNLSLYLCFVDLSENLSYWPNVPYQPPVEADRYGAVLMSLVGSKLWLSVLNYICCRL
jgi:hypothetical protein